MSSQVDVCAGKWGATETTPSGPFYPELMVGRDLYIIESFGSRGGRKPSGCVG